MHLILGAGCAGLSLACALLDAAVDEPILLVDRRTTFEHDRTWCFWSTSANLPFAWLASHGWPAWCLVGRDGRTEVHRSTRHPYLHLPADRFYAVALERLDRAANVELRLGERVLEVHALAEGVRVRTSRGVIEGAVAYDAMGGGGPLNRHRPAGAVELRQCFLGQEVEVERPVFDASTATLMDFRAFGAAAHGDVLRFMYVLPLGPTRALVEDTSLGRGTISPEARRSAIAAYLDTAWAAGAVQIHREERGALPMTTHRFPVSRGSRVLAVGAAAGALRPSSGYAFVRLQRHVQAVARAVVDGAAPPAWLGARRHHGLDALFLRALAADPPGFDQHLLALAGGVDARTFARFMTDASSVREDAAVVAAMARPGFMRAMVKGALGSRQPRRVNLKARATGRAPCDRHPERTRLAYSAPGWVALAVVGALAVVAPDAADTARWLPFLLGLVWFSLPHGAVDHHVPRRLGRTGGPAFVAGYLAAVVAGLAAWALAPVATLAAFLLAAAVHWGSGDAWYARAVHRRAPFRGRLDAALFVAARGALPVALPALAHPAELARAADAILRTVGAGPAPALPGSLRSAGLLLVALLVAAAALAALRSGRERPRAALLDVGELALLAAFFTVTPAILAVGTYLLVWHAPRHIARLIAAEPAQAALPPGRALIAWTREAAPLTVLALASLTLLAATVWRVPATAEAIAGAALALIAALTFPHVAVVIWMDREQAVFAPAAGSGTRPACAPIG